MGCCSILRRSDGLPDPSPSNHRHQPCLSEQRSTASPSWSCRAAFSPALHFQGSCTASSLSSLASSQMCRHPVVNSYVLDVVKSLKPWIAAVGVAHTLLREKTCCLPSLISSPLVVSQGELRTVVVAVCDKVRSIARFHPCCPLPRPDFLQTGILSFSHFPMCRTVWLWSALCLRSRSL